MPKSALTLALAVLSVCGCAENRTERCAEQAAVDIDRILAAWNGREAGEILAIVNAADFMSAQELAQAEEELAELRRSAGASNLQSGILVDGKPEAPGAYAVAHQVLAMERGCGSVSLVYDRSLRIVGFNIVARPLSNPALR